MENKEQDKKIHEDDPALKESPKDIKTIIIVVLVIIGFFALGFTVRYFYHPEADNPTTIDDMHKANIEGKSQGSNYMYNGFSFIYLDNLWYTQVQKGKDLIDVPLHFGPKDLEDIMVIGKLNESFLKKEVYITFDPTEPYFKYIALSSAELSLNLAKGIGVVPVAACDRNETIACENRPIVTCEDDDKAVIYIKHSNNTGIVKMEGNCVELEGRDWELVKATDRFLLHWYNVMR